VAGAAVLPRHAFHHLVDVLAAASPGRLATLLTGDCSAQLVLLGLMVCVKYTPGGICICSHISGATVDLAGRATAGSQSNRANTRSMRQLGAPGALGTLGTLAPAGLIGTDTGAFRHFELPHSQHGNSDDSSHHSAEEESTIRGSAWPSHPRGIPSLLMPKKIRAPTMVQATSTAKNEAHKPKSCIG